MKKSAQDVENVALLSRLELSAEETEKESQVFNRILDYLQVLDSLDTSKTEPTTHVLSLTNVFREDKLEPSLDKEAVFGNAPEVEDGYFKVPRIL